jgi:hypothetical protein
MSPNVEKMILVISLRDCGKNNFGNKFVCIRSFLASHYVSNHGQPHCVSNGGKNSFHNKFV